MPTAYVGLGANLGDRRHTIKHAVERLSELGSVDAASPIFETDPVGYTDQPAFLNAVIRLQTNLPPVALMAHLLAIERGFGRERTFSNAPRRLDLDLLFYDDLIVDDPVVIVPHPRLHQRRFVLVPLAAIAPDLVHPVSRQSVAQLLARLDDDGGVRLFASDVRAQPCAPRADEG